MAEAIGYVVGGLIIAALTAASLYLVVNAHSNIAAGAIGFATAVLFEIIARKCRAK